MMFLPPSDVAILSAILGLTLVPWLVQLIVNEPWKDRTKREIAGAMSLLFAIGQFLFQGGHYESLAVTGPLIFAAASASYIKVWKSTLGPLQEFDFLQAVFGKKL